MLGRISDPNFQYITTTMEARPHDSIKPHIGPLNMDLNTICELCDLRSATHCLSRMIAPAGEAGSWPPDLVHQLAHLARNTRHEHANAMHALLQVWRLRLARYPNSNPDVIAKDVETVCTRMKFLSRHDRKGPEGEPIGAAPQMGQLKRAAGVEGHRGDESPKARRINKGKGPARVQTRSPPPPPPRIQQGQVGESSRTGKRSRDAAPPQTPSRHTPPIYHHALSSKSGIANDVDVDSETGTPIRYVELGDLLAIPEHWTPRQKSMALRQREVIQAADLGYLKACVWHKEK
jgi:hypothetical protein